MKKLCFLLGFSTVVLGAAEYFVSPAGKDTDPGSRGRPFHTIGRAVAAVQAGDTVTVRGGVYHEQLNINKKGTKEKPIVFRGAPGETAVVTGGYPVTTAWKKTPGRRFVWETPAKYAVNVLWDKLNLNRFLEVHSLDMLDEQPGSFMQDRRTKTLYVHPLSGTPPDEVGIVVVPWFGGATRNAWDKSITGNQPLPAGTDTGKYYRWNKGFFITGEYITVENFYVTFFSGQGIRVNKPGRFNTIRNCTVLGTTCGIMDFGASDTKILHNRLLRNAGTGINVVSTGARAVVEDNFLFNNGPCLQSEVEPDSSGGNIFNFAHYGGYDGLNLRRNIMILDDPTRRKNPKNMRCKGGVKRFTEQTGNVFIGGGAELYAQSKSTGNVSGNTMLDGKYTIHEKLPTGESYKVRFENNLIVGEDDADPLFADESYYDYRLRKGSPFAGKGAFPEPAKGFAHVSDTAALNLALRRGDIDTIYLEPGIYSGTVRTAGKSILMRNSGKQRVVFDKASVTGGAAVFEGIIFKNSSLKFTGKAGFKTCVLDKSTLSGKSLLLEKCTLSAAEARAGNLTLSDSLKVGNSNRINASVLLAENNAATDRLDADYRLPAGSPLAYAAFDCGAVGGRPALRKKLPLVLEDVQVTPLPPDRARILCRTPFHYWGTAVFRSNEVRGSVEQRRNRPKRAEIEIILQKLVPGRSYSGTLTVTEENNPQNRTERKISFEMPKDGKRKGVTYIAGEKNPLSKVLRQLLPGDTVIVEPGVYDGGFRIDVDDITLKSRIPGKAVLSSALLYGNILQLNRVKNITVDGFKFGNVTYSALNTSIALTDCRNITVRNCYFDRTRAGNVLFSNIQLTGIGVDGLTVENCIFNSGFQGINLLKAKNILINHNTFWGIGGNAAHIGCEQGDPVTITNNIIADVVGKHHSPAISVAEHGPHITCDYNLYWHTGRAPQQEIYGFGRWKKGHYFSGTWDVMDKNMEKDIRKVRSRFGLEKNGFFADPLFEDHETFRLKKGSPAKGKSEDGTDLGARSLKVQSK